MNDSWFDVFVHIYIIPIFNKNPFGHSECKPFAKFSYLINNVHFIP